jgi:hypothetical protein
MEEKVNEVKELKGYYLAEVPTGFTNAIALNGLLRIPPCTSLNACCKQIELKAPSHTMTALTLVRKGT